MATNQTEQVLEQIVGLIDEACANGDTVSAIADRARVSRPKISRIRNHSLRDDEFPTMETLTRIAEALGHRITIKVQKA